MLLLFLGVLRCTDLNQIGSFREYNDNFPDVSIVSGQSKNAFGVTGGYNAEWSTEGAVIESERTIQGRIINSEHTFYQQVADNRDSFTFEGVNNVHQRPNPVDSQPSCFIHELNSRDCLMVSDFEPAVAEISPNTGILDNYSFGGDTPVAVNSSERLQQLDPNTYLAEFDLELLTSSFCSTSPSGIQSTEEPSTSNSQSHDVVPPQQPEKVKPRRSDNTKRQMKYLEEKVEKSYLPVFWKLNKLMEEVNEALVLIENLKRFCLNSNNQRRLDRYKEKFTYCNKAFKNSTFALVNQFRLLVRTHYNDFAFFDSKEITSPDYYENLSSDSKEEFKRVMCGIVKRGTKTLIKDVMILSQDSMVFIQSFKHHFSCIKI